MHRGCVLVYVKLRIETEQFSKKQTTMRHCNVTVCCLDARLFPRIKDITCQIKKVKAAAGNESVLFLINFPAEHLKIWQEVLVKTFSAKQGYQNVKQYYVNDMSDGEPVGGAVICLGNEKEYPVISHVQFLQPPPDRGCVEFGKLTIYAEIVFSKTAEVETETVGILWAPDLYCVGKPYFNDANYWGAIAFIRVSLAYHMYDHLCKNSPPNPPLEDTLKCMREHLTGIIVLVDMRSTYFGDRYPIPRWHMAGKAHAVLGQWSDGEFQDAYADLNIQPAPACYKIRCRTRQCYLKDHSFDFLGTSLTEWPDEPSASGSGSESLPIVAEEGTLEKNQATVADDPECGVCLARPPTFVFKACRHFGVCGSCRNWMCKQQFNANKEKSGQVSPATLKVSKVENVAISCPYCRKLTKAVHHSKFRGEMFVVC